MFSSDVCPLYDAFSPYEVFLPLLKVNSVAENKILDCVWVAKI